MIFFPLSENGSVAPEVDDGRFDFVQSFVVTLMVIILDERPDLPFDFSLGLWVERSTTDRIHILPVQPIG